MYLIPPAFPTFPYDDDGFEALKDYIQRLEQCEITCLSAPLATGYEFSFDASAPGLPTTEKHRPLPPVLSTGGPLRLRLVRLLRPSKNRSSRSRMSSGVWLAHVVSEGTQDSDSTDSPSPVSVAVKILQPSQMPFPSDTLGDCEDYMLPYYWREYQTPDWIARSEAAGYDLLAELQGIVLPYFFGKAIVCRLILLRNVRGDSLTSAPHQISTPCGEPAWALCTEYIEGKSFAEVLGIDAMNRDAAKGRWRKTNHYHSVDVPEIGEIVSSPPKSSFFSDFLSQFHLLPSIVQLSKDWIRSTLEE